MNTTMNTSMRLNLFAYTPPGFAPPYISINREGDVTTVTVRSPGTPEGDCGACAAIDLDAETFAALLRALAAF